MARPLARATRVPGQSDYGYAARSMLPYEGSIASVTPTVCDLFRVAAPEICNHAPLASVRERFAADLANDTVERCLIYCPDALGDHLWGRFAEQRALIDRHVPHRVAVSAVMPSVTPVCFASIFTGASPEVHGIRRYEKPTLACDTLFDALARSGRKVAIVAVKDSSIDLIFRNRQIDYFSETYDQEVTTRALSLLAEDKHDLILVYHQEYDDQLHATQPFSESCIAAMHHHVATVGQLITAAKAAWHHRRWSAVIAPDHGAHIDPKTQRGDHGLAIPEDLNVSHWYGVYAPSG